MDIVSTIHIDLLDMQRMHIYYREPGVIMEEATAMRMHFRELAAMLR